MSGVIFGAEWTKNQGSTLMQCPPTPGPGCKILTRGWRLASAIISHGSTPSESDSIDNSFAKAMFTSRYEFSVSLVISAAIALVVKISPWTKVS